MAGHGGKEGPTDLEAYSRVLGGILRDEMPHVQGTYLDYGGSSLYTATQLAASLGDLQGGTLTNPHSGNPLSQSTGAVVDLARLEILRFFHTTPADYSVVFTSGATGGLKAIGEGWPWGGGCVFEHTVSNHNSVVGIREYALRGGAVVRPMSDLSGGGETREWGNWQTLEEVRKQHQQKRSPDSPRLPLHKRTPRPPLYQRVWRVAARLLWSSLGARLFARPLLGAPPEPSPPPPPRPPSPCLMAIPAECNFSGQWFDLQRLRACEERREEGRQWYSLLDASAMVGKGDLDLSLVQPDFIVMSFYKAFGYPTGLGALLVRRRAEGVLQKGYFGGGTVDVSFSDVPFKRFRPMLHSKFEDGTLNFQAIAALRHGFAALSRLGGPSLIHQHLSQLRKYAVCELARLRHFNGSYAAEIYGPHQRHYVAACRAGTDPISSPSTEGGGTITFNLRDHKGHWIGFSQVDTMAGLRGIHLRTGCFCNPGACQQLLDLSMSDRLAQVDSGHVCMDAKDVLDGKPTGAVRASLGPYSTQADVDVLISFIREFFVVEAPPEAEQTGVEGTSIPLRVSELVIYPIKSCAGVSLSSSGLTQTGLKYDRMLLIADVQKGGSAIGQRTCPKVAQIRPRLSPTLGILVLTAPGMRDISLPLSSIAGGARGGAQETTSIRVRGEERASVSLEAEEGVAVDKWLSTYLDRPVRLLRTETDKSFANEGQYLLASEASCQDLGDRMGSESGPCQFGISCFRPNIVIQGGTPWQEDGWSGLEIGGVEYDVTGDCSRCTMVNRDHTGASDQHGEPLLTLSKCHRSAQTSKALFGIFLNSGGREGTVSCGQEVRVLRQRSRPELAPCPPNSP